MAILKLLRAPEKNNEKTEMIIYINGAKSGSLKIDEQKSLTIPEGHHKLAIKLSNFSGLKTRTFRIKEDEAKGFIIYGNGKANSFEPIVSGI